ncbi:hypothetical protein DO73_5959 [Burkholderia pseudomallei]|nr:hypothetical protein DO73_5959 [Burkholderia pseudomallei]
MRRERIHERVGDRVVRLPGIADDAGARRERHEEIEAAHVARREIQIHGAAHLRRQHLRELVGRLAQQIVVAQHAGAMHDAVQRAELADDRLDHPRDRVAIGDIQHAVVGRDAERAKARDERAHVVAGGRAPGEHERRPRRVPADSARDRVGQRPREAAGRAGHEIHAALTPRQRARAVRRGRLVEARHLALAVHVADARIGRAARVAREPPRQVGRVDVVDRDHLPVQQRILQVRGLQQRAERMQDRAGPGRGHDDLHERRLPHAGREQPAHFVEQRERVRFEPAGERIGLARRRARGERRVAHRRAAVRRPRARRAVRPADEHHALRVEPGALVVQVGLDGRRAPDRLEPHHFVRPPPRGHRDAAQRDAQRAARVAKIDVEDPFVRVGPHPQPRPSRAVRRRMDFGALDPVRHDGHAVADPLAEQREHRLQRRVERAGVQFVLRDPVRRRRELGERFVAVHAQAQQHAMRGAIFDAEPREARMERRARRFVSRARPRCEPRAQRGEIRRAGRRARHVARDAVAVRERLGRGVARRLRAHVEAQRARAGFRPRAQLQPARAAAHRQRIAPRDALDHEHRVRRLAERPRGRLAHHLEIGARRHHRPAVDPVIA